MKNTTYLALLTAVSMTAPANAVAPVDSAMRHPPESDGKTVDEVGAHPGRETAISTDAEAEANEVNEAISIIKNTQSELDRIKDALLRIRRMNPELTAEQLSEVKERLMQRARELVTNARNISSQIQQLPSGRSERIADEGPCQPRFE